MSLLLLFPESIVVVDGSLGVTESQDTCSFSGSIQLSGTLTGTDAQDTAVYDVILSVSGALIVAEDQDSALCHATISGIIPDNIVPDLYGGSRIWVPEEVPYNDDEEVLHLFSLVFMEVTRWEV